MLYRHYYGITKQPISRLTLLMIACLFSMLAVVLPAGAQGKSEGQADSVYSLTGHYKGKSELLHVSTVKTE